MSASTIKPVRPRNRLGTLATAVTWVFWFAVLAAGLRVILALSGQRPWFVFGGSGVPPAVCLETAPPLLQHAGSGLILGWWLLAGELVATFAAGFARVNLLGQLVTWHVNWVHWPASWGVSWPVVWFGLGLVIFARIMRTSAGMRADLEGTV